LNSAPSLRYLGVAGWAISVGGRTLLIDPYFSRLPLRRMLIGKAIPDREAIRRCCPAGEWALVSHAHFDHAMDLPEVLRLTGACACGSRQTAALLDVLGVPAERMTAIGAGGTFTLGPFTVEAYETPHRLIFGRVPAYGSLKPGLRPPLRALDYRMDRQFSFRITVEGIRLLVCSGVDDEPHLPAAVLIVGPDMMPEKRETLIEAVRPRLVLPNHWDDLFRPLNKPIRAMRPPHHPLPPTPRMDLEAFKGEVQARHSGVRVLLPGYFEEIGIADWLL
jgi:L-ascorbate metabolism protein UlaG (beta-lactamase superfamily)